MLDELRDEITKQIKSETDKVYEQIRKVKSKLSQQDAENVELKNVLSDTNVRVEKLEKENERLLKRNKELKDQIEQKNIHLKKHDSELNDIEQYTRRNSIRIYGINDSDRNESSPKTIESVVSLVNNKLEVSITARDVDTAHRLGPFRQDGNRPVICKFVSRETKHAVIRARKKLKGSAMIIREDLTQKNAKLLEMVSRRDEIQSAWSDEGKIIALLRNGRKIKVGLDSNLNRPLDAQ